MTDSKEKHDLANNSVAGDAAADKPVTSSKLSDQLTPAGASKVCPESGAHPEPPAPINDETETQTESSNEVDESHPTIETNGIPNSDETANDVKDQNDQGQGQDECQGQNPTIVAPRVTPQEMEMTQLRVKVICQEKNILALRLELKSAELKLASAETLNEKKTRLVELLDSKLAATESRNIRLHDMVEQMLREKGNNSVRLKEASGHLEDLTKRLVDSERLKTELVKVNAELKKMLENIQNKGTQIARLAKEKVLKFKEDNERMHRELHDLRGSSPDSSDEATTFESTTSVPLDPTNPPSEPVSSPSLPPLAGSTSRPSDSTQISELDAKFESILDLHSKSLQLLTQLQADDFSDTKKTRQSIQEAAQLFESLRDSLTEIHASASKEFSAERVNSYKLRGMIGNLEGARKNGEKREEVQRAQLAECEGILKSKEEEIGKLREEIQRLKSAIGQLIGT